MTDDQIKARAKLMTKITAEVTERCQKILLEAAEEMPDTDSRIGIMIVASSHLYAAMLHATKAAGKVEGTTYYQPHARLILSRYGEDIQDNLIEVANAATE